MSEATTISAILKSTAKGPAWHGPSVMELLDGITAEQALKHPLEECHSIWELLLHIDAWQEYALTVLRGGEMTTDQVQDWRSAPAEASAEEWETLKRHFEGVGEELRETVVHLDESKLQNKVPGREFKLKVLLHGITDHTIYHAGQIALLKKLV